LLLCVTVASWGQDEAALLNQLASNDAGTREKAHESLVQKGPAILGALFNQMGGENKTEDLWARRTAEKIVYRATRPGAKKERAAAEKGLLQVVEGDYAPGVKYNAFQLLSLVGGRATVAALADRLDDPGEREIARWTLERIPESSATNALIKALGKAQEPEWKVALIKTLGSRRDAKGRSIVLKAFRDPSPEVRMTAIAAAGRLPDSRTRSSLWKVWDEGAEKEKKVAADALLHMAEAWTVPRTNKSAVAIYRRFYDEAPSSLLRCAGLSGLARAAGEKAVPDLLAALEEPDIEVRGVAQDRLSMMPGENVTLALVKALGKSEGESRLGLIRLLGHRRDPASAAATPLLIQAVNDTKAAEELRTAAGSALARIPGEEPTRAILKAMEGTSPELQAGWLRVLGQRGDRKALPVVLESAKSPEKGVRIAALEALGQLGDAEAVSSLRAALQESDQEIKNAAVKSAVPVSIALGKAGRKQEAVDLCVAAASATTDTRLLGPLADRLAALGATEYVAEMAARNGFVVHWWVIGPLANRDSLRQRDIIPADQPVDISQPVKMNRREYQWKYVEIGNPLGQLDLERAAARRDNVGAYLYAEVESDQARESLFKIGSDDDVFCWLNGELVHKFVGDRGWSPDQDIAHVQLKAGTNRILMKVLNGGAQWAMSLRITDLDGKPLRLRQRR
jgi:HEAT repeat protein